MPFMSGFDVLERVTKIAPDSSYLPFVFLTTLTDRENELKGRQHGADDYITKPVDFDILVAIINVRLERAIRNNFPPDFADFDLH
jgi:DNA-binding response OmpR family regulator